MTVEPEPRMSTGISTSIRLPRQMVAQLRRIARKKGGIGYQTLLKIWIAERLEKLPEKQRQVLALYYFEDLRLREIAAVFGVSESRICQIHTKAILAIRAALQRFDPCLA